ASNDNLASNTYSVTNDGTAPSVTIDGPAGPVNGSFDVTITFSEDVTGFVQNDITITNGTITAFSGSEASYTATINPTTDGEVTVQVPAGVALDAASNDNLASNIYSIINDGTATTVTIDGPAGPVNGSFDITITFSEGVTGFVQSDITITNGTITAFSGSGASYTATIDPTTDGEVTVQVPAGVAIDAASNDNLASNTYSVTNDGTAPSVTIDGPAGPVNGSFDVTITFSEDVTGFVQSDITITNGTITAFSGSGASYTATIDPTADGEVTVQVPAGVAMDAANNDNLASNIYSIINDGTAPSVTIDGPAGPVNGSFDVTITFSEGVTGFVQSDITVTNGSITAFSGSGASYTATIDPTADGEVTVQVPAGVAMDAANNDNLASNTYSVTNDGTAPSVTIDGPAGPVNGSFDITITFSEGVTGFVQSDITVTNGSITAFSGSGASYTATIDPTADGEVTVQVPAGVAMDAA
ncbi:beta strand repeat-containing protein, partial [Leptobacterium sp. I13]|uniref:beta strand repeat-containing protein n=1 Tax=Leptobacterium meishanense TaxID=3128904 RepID=UPI0030ECBFBB